MKVTISGNIEIDVRISGVGALTFICPHATRDEEGYFEAPYVCESCHRLLLPSLMLLFKKSDITREESEKIDELVNTIIEINDKLDGTDSKTVETLRNWVKADIFVAKMFKYVSSGNVSPKTVQMFKEATDKKNTLMGELFPEDE